MTLYDTLNSGNPHQLDTPFQDGVLQQGAQKSTKKKFQAEASRKATYLEHKANNKAAKEIIPQTFDSKVRLQVEFDNRPKGVLENKTISAAKPQFPKVVVEPTLESPMSVVANSNITSTGRLKSVETMFDELKDDDLNLRDLMFLMQQVQTLLSSEHERLLGPHLLNMGDHAQVQSDDLAAEKRAKKVAFLMVIGGILELGGSLLMAGKATGLVIPVVDKFLPTFLKGGELISTGGKVTNTLGNVTNNYSQAEQQKLQHVYQRSMERMSELQRMKNQRGQEKNQALQKIAEQEAAYQRLVQELLTRQG